MPRILFENNKAALAFAAVTLIGAAMFVSSQDGSAVRDRAMVVDQIEPNEALARPRSLVQEHSDGGIAAPEFSEWASDQPVFDDFAPEGALTDQSQEIGPSPLERQELPLGPGRPPSGSGVSAQGGAGMIVPGGPGTGE